MKILNMYALRYSSEPEIAPGEQNYVLIHWGWLMLVRTPFRIH